MFALLSVLDTSGDTEQQDIDISYTPSLLNLFATNTLRGTTHGKSKLVLILTSTYCVAWVSFSI